MTYDSADWHYDGDFPEDLPPEAGGTHIGMFLAWVITRGLEGKKHREEPASAAAALRFRHITGREFLFTQCDERLWDKDLSDEGNAFAMAYYEAEGYGGYLSDYEEMLGEGLPSLYHVENSWENFDKLAPRIDQRYQEWKRGRR
jgi:hypothetical protein